ncbi:MAG: thiamine phosphate synthase [bacterium]
MFPRDARIYPITDVRLSGLSHAEQTRRLIEGGAAIIQLREKHQPAREFFRQAVEALTIARERGVKLIINDRVDIALASDADGVHLGQDDLSPAAARRILGPEKLIGFSTHNLQQALDATQMPIDYLAIGPIFSTSSKTDAHSLVGLDNLREIRKAVGKIPVVAIGGIDEGNAPEVIRAGADCIAAIGALLKHPNEIASRTRNLLMTIQSGPP